MTRHTPWFVIGALFVLALAITVGDLVLSDRAIHPSGRSPRPAVPHAATADPRTLPKGPIAEDPAKAKDPSAATSTTDPASGGKPSVPIDPAKLGSVVGTVTSPDGRAVAGASIAPATDEGAPVKDSPAGAAVTDELGRYRLAALAGTAHLIASANGYGPSFARVDVPAGREATCNFRLPAPLAIAGCVKDNEGRTIAGATVALTWIAQSEDNDEGMYERKTTTDATGRYRFEDLHSGRHQVCASASGFARVEKFDVMAGSSDVDFVLVRGGRIEGKVVRACDGAPAERAVIVCRVSTEENPLPVGQATVDAKGIFAVVGVSAGRYRITARAHALAEGRSEEISVADGETRTGVVIALVSGGTLRGVVLSARTRAPIAGASVTRLAAVGVIDQDADRMLDNPNGPTTTDEAGRFEMACLPLGRIRVRVEHPDFSPMIRVFDVEDGKTLEQEFLLGDGARVYGRVTGPDAAPRTGTAVWAVGPPPGDPRTTETDHDGRYEFRGLNAGAWSVSLDTPDGGVTGGSRTDTREVQVREGDSVEVNFAASETVRAFGTVRRGGKVQSGIQLEWSGASRSGSTVTVRTDEAGAYEVPSLVAGDYWVTFDGTRIRVAVPGGREARIDIDIPLGGISGRVLDRETRAAVAEAAVMAYYADLGSGAPNDGQRYAAFVQADASGAFAIEGLPPGGYTLEASKEGYAPELLGPVTVPKEGRAEGVEVLLGAARGRRDEGGEGRGGCRPLRRRGDAAGKPLADAVLTLFDAAGQVVESAAGPDCLLFPSMLRTGPQGWLERLGVAPGHYRGEVSLGMRKGGFEVDVVADQVAEVEVTLK